MKPVIRVTIALGLMGLSLAGCGSPSKPSQSIQIFVLFSLFRAQSVQDLDRPGRFQIGVVRKVPGYLIGEK